MCIGKALTGILFSALALRVRLVYMNQVPVPIISILCFSINQLFIIVHASKTSKHLSMPHTNVNSGVSTCVLTQTAWCMCLYAIANQQEQRHCKFICTGMHAYRANLLLSLQEQIVELI